MRVTLTTRTPGAPGIGWQVPEHLVREAKRHKLNEQESLDLTRCHHVAISRAGELCPVVITGYRQHPDLPIRFMGEVSGGDVIRHEHLTGDSTFDVYSSADEEPGQINLWASLVVSDLVDTTIGLNGVVFICSPPDQAGVIGKLALPIKARVAASLRAFTDVHRGLKPLGMTDEAYEDKRRVMERVLHLVRALGSVQLPLR